MARKETVEYDCDLHLRAAHHMPATYRDVPLVMGDKQVTLDLCDGDFRDLADFLARYFEAGQKLTRSPSKRPGAKGRTPSASAPRPVRLVPVPALESVQTQAQPEPATPEPSPQSAPAAASTTTPARQRTSYAEAKATNELNTRIREWAANKGYSVRPRGKIPDKVVTEYLRAHPNRISQVR